MKFALRLKTIEITDKSLGSNPAPHKQLRRLKFLPEYSAEDNSQWKPFMENIEVSISLSHPEDWDRFELGKTYEFVLRAEGSSG